MRKRAPLQAPSQTLRMKIRNKQKWQRSLSAIIDNQKWLAYLILAPVVILIFFMAYFPAIQSFRFSLMYYNTRLPERIHFVGLNNYIRILKDPLFLEALKRTAYFVVIAVGMILSIALVFSLVLNENFKGRSILRALVILAWAIPPVVNGFMWKWLLSGDFGFLNGILYQFGLISSYEPWLKDPFMALNWATLTFVWRFTPFVTILLLGALQSIPLELYDSAKVDGAGARSCWWHITLPLLRPMLTIALIIIMIFAFTVFDEIYTLTGLDPATKTLMMYGYELAFEKGRFGIGSALAYIIGILMFLITYFYIKSIYREVKH